MKSKQIILVFMTVLFFSIIEFVLKIKLDMNILNTTILQRTLNGNNCLMIISYEMVRLILITISIIILLNILKFREYSIIKILIKVFLTELAIFIINTVFENIYAPSFIIFLTSCISIILYYTVLVYIIYENRFIAQFLKIKGKYCVIIIAFCCLYFINNRIFIHILFQNFEYTLWWAFNQNTNMIIFDFMNKVISCILFISLILIFNEKFIDENSKI
ncbi:hypothetical protein SH1V18_45430 [Vallitalea longa]|uniref:Uncharacterized protein n=1 Tax=Vallitalea longa TaxID=2936439 RepID=A0A9W5YGW3_9FIRM|nr:hypothetical protein SH1V18_45430 [Vallitalea longa]